MIRKQIVLTAFLFISVFGFSQETQMESPNYKKIEKEILKADSKFYYPKLMKRYQASDTTMTLKEKRYLYYGYSFHKDYSPYGFSVLSDSLRTILKRQSHNEQDLNSITKLSDSILATNPFDLRVMNYQLYAYEKLKKNVAFNKRLIQARILVDALLSSGNGLKKETAFYVIYVPHEYDILNILGYEFGGMQSLIEHYDFLKLAENPKKIEGLYFDISPSLNSMNKMFK